MQRPFMRKNHSKIVCIKLVHLPYLPVFMFKLKFSFFNLLLSRVKKGLIIYTLFVIVLFHIPLKGISRQFRNCKFPPPLPMLRILLLRLKSVPSIFAPRELRKYNFLLIKRGSRNFEYDTQSLKNVATNQDPYTLGVAQTQV